jgi:hypothetical protein
MAEHDQRFKALLREFFPEFLHLFFPDRAARLDLSRPEWLDKELFPDPPQGDVRVLDLVARVPHLPPLDTPDQPVGGTVALVHVEVESREAVATFRRRMFQYYETLRRRYDEPVLPVAVYLRVGLDGLGMDGYTEEYDGLELLRFQYLYVGLPALDAERYVSGDNWLGVALSALMRASREQRVRLGADALLRMAVECKENDFRKYLLTECIEAYLNLDEEQQREFDQLKQTEPYKEIQPMMTTTFEKGMVQGQRKTLRAQLEHRFGPLSPAVLEKLESLSPDRLAELQLAVLTAPSLKALELEG